MTKGRGSGGAEDVRGIKGNEGMKWHNLEMSREVLFYLKGWKGGDRDGEGVKIVAWEEEG